MEVFFIFSFLVLLQRVVKGVALTVFSRERERCYLFLIIEQRKIVYYNNISGTVFFTQKSRRTDSDIDLIRTQINEGVHGA